MYIKRKIQITDIWKFFPLILILNYVPFVFRGNYIEMSISILIFGLIFLLSFAFRFKYIIPGSFVLFVIVFGLIYLSYHLVFNFKYILATIHDFILVLICIVVCFKFIENNSFLSFYRLWLFFLLIIGSMTIISYTIFYFGILPFYYTELGGYDVMYNNWFLGGMHLGPFFRRPSLYFNEPSYLGFFVGLNIFFLLDVEYKHKTRLIAALILAGMLSGSMTLFIGFSVVLIVQLVFKNLLHINTAGRAGIYFLIFILVSFAYSSFKDQFLEVLDFGSRLDRDMRSSRSINILGSSSVIQLLFGHGSTYIAKTDTFGESNAYLRLVVENGLIAIALALAFIYQTLKKNPELMFFVLLTLHSVVLFLTPLVICFLMFVYYYYYHLEKNAINNI